MLLGNGDGTFQEAQNFNVGSQPTRITNADFNGDGKQDLATANQGSNNVSVLLGNGDGTFQDAQNFNVVSPRGITSADFNRDGKPDLATADSNNPGTVSVLLNTTTFPPPVAKNDFFVAKGKSFCP